MRPTERRISLPFWLFFVVVSVVGVIVTFQRFSRGLGAVTNLNDDVPWGLWVGFDILGGVALAAGAFVLAATVHIFHLERYKPLLRPALLTGFLGYALEVAALLFDLGRPYRIWHVIIYWQVHSVMFLVAWCAMLYFTVLFLEFLPTALEGVRWGPLSRLYRLLKSMTVPLVIVGAVVSVLHQSSLGSLYLIAPDKLSPIWYSPLLPVHFFVSAVLAGLGMVILESCLCSRIYGHGLRHDLLAGLARAGMVVLWLYSVLRLGDLVVRGELSRAFAFDLSSISFLAELLLGAVVPAALFSMPAVRRSAGGLIGGAALIVFGVVLNRLNVSIIGMGSGASYFPRWTEFAITIFLIACGVAAFAIAVRVFPVFEEEAHPDQPDSDGNDIPQGAMLREDATA